MVSESSLESVAITAVISNDSIYHYIRLSGLNNSSNKEKQKISGAEITVSGGGQSYPFYEHEQKPGIYKSAEAFKAEPGVDYTIKVRYNNTEYSASEKMPFANPGNKSEFPPFVLREYHSHIFISSDEHIFGCDYPNIWFLSVEQRKFEDYYSSLVFLPERMYTHHGTYMNGKYPIGSLGIGRSGKRNDTIEFIKYNITDDYYRYLLGVFNESVWGGSMFSVVKGNVESNISNGGHGYFSCVYTQRFKYSFNDLVDSLGLEPINY
jgi:hypothetical protein